MSEIDIYEWEDKKDDTTFKEHMIAGCIAGIAEHVCMLPMDNIKVNTNKFKIRLIDFINISNIKHIRNNNKFNIKIIY
jgi:protein tyrosine phosphatase